MANPQKEKGYTAIANEIYEALARVQIPSESRRILDVILRKTYGFQKKEDLISLSQFAKATGLLPTNIPRSIKKLVTMRIIIKIDTKLGSKYRFQKDFDKWVTVESKRGGIRTDTINPDSIKADILPVSKLIDTKETITKEINMQPAVADSFPKPFNTQAYIQDMLVNPKRHIQVIGVYWQFKGIEFANVGQARDSVKRDLRAARGLENYSDRQLLAVMDFITTQDFIKKWGLETVGKYINEV